MIRGGYAQTATPQLLTFPLPKTHQPQAKCKLWKTPANAVGNAA
jgi:hypothetical protein